MGPSVALKRFLLAAGVVVGLAGIAVAALLAGLVFWDPFGEAPHPADAAMIEQFKTQQPALEALLAMIREDPDVQRLAPDFTRPEPLSISAARLADYRQRLAAAGIRHGFSHYGDETTFIVSTRGLAIAGSGKSIVHADDAGAEAIVIDGDLDAAASERSREQILLRRPLAPHWWLELDRR